MYSSILLKLLASNTVVFLFSMIVARICTDIHDEHGDDVFDRVANMAIGAMIVSFLALPVLAIAMIWLQ